MNARGSLVETGSVIGGYRIDELISRGGMGVVYRATNLALNRIYALKVLAPEFADDEDFRERFKREIRIAASLNHPNVVAIHYAGEHDGLLFLVMDLIDGTNLRDVIARSGALDPERAVALLEQITSALDAAHRKGLVHRDVKPANVLLKVQDGEEHAFLTDFGLAKRFDTVSALTVAGLVVGTVHYMSPEQITGSHTDARADIYALGCVLYEMLTGKVPYAREHSVATLFAQVYDPPPSLEGSVAASHPTLGPVIAKAMAKDPGDRYISAGDLARDAAAALQGTRFMGTPTVVATGDALPTDDQEDAGGERAQATLDAIQGAMHEPATQSSDASPDHAAATDVVASSEAAAPVPQPAPPLRVSRPPQTTPVPPGPQTIVGSSLGVPVESAPPPGDGPHRPPSDSSFRRRRWVAAGLLALLAGGGGAAAIALTSSSSTPKPKPPVPKGTPFAAGLKPVPTNHVTATGRVTLRLNGDMATVSIRAAGLLNGAPHAMHIHAGGLGICPPASAARLHNGHLSISTTDGIIYYGDAVASLTTRGDTSPRSIVDFTRYPTTGDIRYLRTIRVSAAVAAEIRRDDAVIVIHGIDYNGSGVYDNVLGASDLGNSLTGDSTAPALCGTLAASTQATTANAHVSSKQVVYTASLVVRELPMTGPGMYWCSPTLADATAPGTADSTRRVAAS